MPRSKSKSYPQRQLAQLRREFLRTNRRRLLIFVCIMLGLGVLVSLPLMLLSGGMVAAYCLGAVHASLIAVSVFGVHYHFVVGYADARNQVVGMWGEEFTAESLGRLRRRKVIWGWVDGIALQGMDIDHLVVTREAGLLALDSKHRGRLDDATLRAVAGSAERAARKADSVLRTLEVSVGRARGRRAAPAPDFRVRPVVVLWGKAQRELEQPVHVNGVWIVPGSKFEAWLKRGSSDSVAAAHAKELIARLEEFRDRVDPIARPAAR